MTNLRKKGAPVAPRTPAADAAENIPAAAGWPDGFTPPANFYDPDAPAQVAAFVATLRAGFDPAAFNAPARPVPVDVPGLGYALKPGEKDLTTGREAFLDCLADLYASAPFLRYMTELHTASAYATGRPALRYASRCGGDEHKTQAGTLAEYTCELTGQPFYVPAGAPVPTIVAPRPSVAGDGDPEGQAYTWSYTVHPSLIDAGPPAVARAMLAAVRGRMSEIAEMFGEVVDLAAMVAAMPPEGPGAEWPANAYREERVVKTPGGSLEEVYAPHGYYTEIGRD